MTKPLVALLLLACVWSAVGDITGTDPPTGSCLCLVYNAVNVRNAACGAVVIGMENAGTCFTYSGTKEACTMDGTYYEYYQLDYNGGDGWIAGTFLIVGSASECSNTEGYACPTDQNNGMRIHETTAPTEYDCVDNSCQNTCQGGQCVALITCSCKKNGQWPPGTQCWSPGTKLRQSDGRCNRNIASGTAIATFDGLGNYYYGHTAIFVECSDDYTIRVQDQWCCRSVGYSNYPSSHSYYPDFAVIVNGGCADRASWACRIENAGPTCCATSVAGCEMRRHWWDD